MAVNPNNYALQEEYRTTHIAPLRDLKRLLDVTVHTLKVELVTTTTNYFMTHPRGPSVLFATLVMDTPTGIDCRLSSAVD